MRLVFRYKTETTYKNKNCIADIVTDQKVVIRNSWLFDKKLLHLMEIITKNEPFFVFFFLFFELYLQLSKKISCKRRIMLTARRTRVNNSH